MAPTSGRDQQVSEEMIDATLADSFPASDPPSWTLGRDRNDQEKSGAVAVGQTSKIPDKERSNMQTNIDLSEEQRTGVVKILNTLLSDEYLLYTKTRNYHWNVTGPQFNDLHKFFEEQYTQLSEIVDQVAERGRTLDGWAFGTMSEFSQHARLKEHPGHYPRAREMIANLVDDHETVIRQLRSDLDSCADKYHDMGTNDFLTGLMEQHEKMAWMLRAFLRAESV
jgi:starvation-inducible DNA-binding protein